jgi:hypothetical protein
MILRYIITEYAEIIAISVVVAGVILAALRDKGES